ncbi:MAG: sensor domain-containing diguanylate cyclase [Desulfurivibrionaceae bacterium]|nr:sensor domain-containing diguanylate cyclase [Desulfurivibrionaceae bacterium]
MSNRALLRLIIATSFLAVVFLSSLSIFVLSPAYKRLIIRNTELEAVKIARHLQAMVVAEGNGSLVESGPAFVEMVLEVVRDFGLMKIKLFAPDGETLFSTAPRDIGVINRHDYFHRQVARGEVFTKVIRKDEKSLEKQVVTVDVVETYVPIMAAGKFLGAFEIYLEITEEIRELEGLLFRTNGLMLLAAGGLFVALLVISRRALLNLAAHERAQRRIVEQSEELRIRNHELSVINDISRVLSESTELRDLLPQVLETVVDRLAVLRLAWKGGIMLVNGERMELVAHLGHPESFLALHQNLTIRDCLCGLAVRTGEVICSADSHDDAHHTIVYPGMEPHGHIIVPLRSGSRVVGVLYLYLPVDTEVGEDNLELLKSIGNQIGLAVDNVRLYEETKRLALHDPLTGLANRRYMEMNLKKAINLAERYRQPLTVALLDIDYFKAYNDTYGHTAGDELLVEVAGKLIKGTRNTDQPAARYGGEEFLLTLPSTGLEGGGIVAERIRKAIGDELGITVSIGLAEFQPGISRDALVDAADQALYRAKENGRNRVECAPRLSSSPRSGGPEDGPPTNE